MHKQVDVTGLNQPKGFAVEPLSPGESRRLEGQVTHPVAYRDEYAGVGQGIKASNAHISSNPADDFSVKSIGSEISPELIQQITLIAQVLIAIPNKTRTVREWLIECRGLCSDLKRASRFLHKNKTVYEDDERLIQEAAHKAVLNFVGNDEPDLYIRGYTVVRPRPEGDAKPGLYAFVYQSKRESRCWHLVIDGLCQVQSITNCPCPDSDTPDG